MHKLKERLKAIAEEARSLRAELGELAEADELNEEQEARFAELAADEGPIERLAAEKAEIERKIRVLETAERVGATEPGEDRTAPQFMKPTETRVDVRTASRGEVRDAALKLLETEGRATELSDASAERVEKLLRSGVKLSNDGEVVFDPNEIARRMVLTETPEYRSAFAKGISSPTPAFDADEVRALNEFRAQSLTAGEGGYAVPVLIDPTIILTTGAADAPILRVARVETITNNVWKGVSSAPASWSYDTEGSAVSDDAVTLAQPVVTAYTARAFIPYSIEIGGDYPNFAAEMRRVIEQGYVDRIAATSMTGTGSDQPFGIFTAIDAAAAREVLVTTSGSLGPEDVFKAWNHLGERFRGRSSWFSSVSVESEVREGASNNAGLYTVNLTADGLALVNGRPWYLTDYAPAFTGTTGSVNLLVLGDFSNFVIAQRAGMSIELVPHLFDVTDNRPTGQRGLFAWARHGMDSVNDAAFVLLKNSS